MVNAIIYLEGGGESKELHSRCREGFHKLLEQNGFKGKMPRLKACGSRNAAFNDFRIAHQSRTHPFVALWIDSEDPVADIEKTWAHLKKRDGWEQPEKSSDEQVFFMTTCMETLIATDRNALKECFKNNLQESALPPLNNLESKSRKELFDILKHATRNCPSQYEKGKKSFELLGLLDAKTLRQHLPSVERTWRILDNYLS
ncbi:MAG: DUF4276 family protein [Chlorobium sp.]|jgi:hypothetical protein|nr:DUF4276 family protein [Chlorobium sp.]